MPKSLVLLLLGFALASGIATVGTGEAWALASNRSTDQMELSHCLSLQQLQEEGILKAALKTIDHVADTTSNGTTSGKLREFHGKFEFILPICYLIPLVPIICISIIDYVIQSIIHFAKVAQGLVS